MEKTEQRTIYSILYTLEKLYNEHEKTHLRSKILSEINLVKSWLKGENIDKNTYELVEFRKVFGTTVFRKNIIPLIEKNRGIKIKENIWNMGVSF